MIFYIIISRVLFISLGPHFNVNSVLNPSELVILVVKPAFGDVLINSEAASIESPCISDLELHMYTNYNIHNIIRQNAI
jgi:hypothetical protein